MISTLKKIRRNYNWGERFLTNSEQIAIPKLSEDEIKKVPLRSDVINFLINSLRKSEINYLEIGVRNPADNFEKVVASQKYSVDPGVEFKENPVDFKVTSDEFFMQLETGKILNPKIRFDVIFIDGLHLADQVERDIKNALKFINDEGFVVLHDCNPPSEWHARENYYYDLTPAYRYWNGTTWKAFVKARKSKEYFSCCVDTDWGIGVISKKINLGPSNNVENDFFEFHVFEKYKKESLNLISYMEFKEIFNSKFD